jgi:hypothetical protein
MPSSNDTDFMNEDQTIKHDERFKRGLAGPCVKYAHGLACTQEIKADLVSCNRHE